MLYVCLSRVVGEVNDRATLFRDQVLVLFLSDSVDLSQPAKPVRQVTLSGTGRGSFTHMNEGGQL